MFPIFFGAALGAAYFLAGLVFYVVVEITPGAGLCLALFLTLNMNVSSAAAGSGSPASETNPLVQSLTSRPSKVGLILRDG